MTKEAFWIIATHPENGVLVEKHEFTDQDEEFLDDEEGWDSFDAYIDYHLEESVAELAQRFYSAVVVKNDEREEIIKSLSEE